MGTQGYITATDINKEGIVRKLMVVLLLGCFFSWCSSHSCIFCFQTIVDGTVTIEQLKCIAIPKGLIRSCTMCKEHPILVTKYIRCISKRFTIRGA